MWNFNAKKQEKKFLTDFWYKMRAKAWHRLVWTKEKKQFFFLLNEARWLNSEKQVTISRGDKDLYGLWCDSCWVVVVFIVRRAYYRVRPLYHIVHISLVLPDCAYYLFWRFVCTPHSFELLPVLYPSTTINECVSNAHHLLSYDDDNKLWMPDWLTACLPYVSVCHMSWNV